MPYLYETHCHTSEISRCATASGLDQLKMYKDLGYSGVFITNHFLDGNIRIDDRDMPYEDKIRFFFSTKDELLKAGEELGIQVFFGCELSYGGADFLIYGLDEDFYLAHPEIMTMKKSEELPFLHDAGALVIQAHPFREAHYIDHIRLYPRSVEGVEIINSSQNELANRMAGIYAEEYGLLPFAGSDNHHGGVKQPHLAGLAFDSPLADMDDFIRRVRARECTIFTKDLSVEQN